MTWYYAIGNERQGPVDDAELDRLIAAGTVTDDTLVWRAGMADWQPLAQARPRAARPATPADVTRAVPVASSTPVPAASDPATQPRFGTPGFGTPGFGAPGAASAASERFESADEIFARVTSTGRNFSIGDVVGRAWNVVSTNFGSTVGVTALAIIVLVVASIIPCIGGIIQLLIQGPIMGGLYVFFLKFLRGRQGTLDDAMSGFSQFLPLFLNALVAGVLIFLALVPGLVIFLVGTSLSEQGGASEAVGILFAIVGFAVMFVPVLYLSVAWSFAVPLIVDKSLGFWEAMELSRKVVQKHFFGVFGLMIVNACIAIVGVLALCLGLFVALPVCFAALAATYDDLFGGAPEAR